jgi:predicted XRE-type DNA-binding protein
MKKPETYASVWDAIADTPGQAANLRARAELMRQIAACVKRRKWTQAEAASHCGVTQPRINDLLRGRVSRFSLDALVNISTALGCRVRLDLDAALGALLKAPPLALADIPRNQNPGMHKSGRDIKQKGSQTPASTSKTDS